MRVPSNRWLSLILVLVVVGILVFRVLGPRFTKSAGSTAIRDLSSTSPLNQPGGGEISSKAYEVYSALYQEPDEPLAFAEDSQTDIPQVDGSCLKPSTPQEREMEAAFVAANQQSHPWEKKFAIPVSYQLISRSESAKAEDCIASHDKSLSTCQPYQSIRHVRYLGVPGFDHTYTRALVSVIKMCGSHCGGGGIFEVEKSGDTWKRAQTADFFSNCSWMY